MNPFIYQTEPTFFALLGEGLAEWGAAELQDIGVQSIKEGYRGFYFEAQPETLYRMLYTTRLFSRVLAPLIRFDCHSVKYLYRRIHETPWERFMTPDHTFAVQAVTTHSAIRHSRHAALTVKDAIADRFREQCGRRPNVDTRAPDIALHLFLQHNHAVCSLDLSGGSLHRRGYREHAVEAPMQETLAAAMVRASGWSGDRPLVDPFCGSGTLLAEAWMVACQIPSGYLRTKWGLQFLPDFDKHLWRAVTEKMNGRIDVPGECSLRGSDKEGAAVMAARANLARLPEGSRIHIEQADFQSLKGWNDTLILSNPPYGVRLGQQAQAASTLKLFGDFLKQRCAGSEACIFFGDQASVKTLGLKPSWQRAVRNGGLDGRLCHYNLFAGPADQQRRFSKKPVRG